MIRFGFPFLALTLACAACCGCDSKTKRTSATMNIQQLKLAIEQYRQDYNAIPPIPRGLNALSTSYERQGHQFGPWIADKSVLSDPWGRPYVYRNPATGPSGYDLFSSGPDGKAGTSDDVH